MNRQQRRAAPRRHGAPDADSAVAALLQQALAAEHGGDLPAAVRSYRKLIELKPDHAAAHNNLGFVLLAQGKTARAGDHLARAVIEDPLLLDQFGEVIETLKRLNPALIEAMARAAAAWPQRLSIAAAFGTAGLSIVTGDRYLRAVLETTVVRNIDLEHLLTGLRAALLQSALTVPAPADRDGALLDAGCLLAMQCFSNEFAFAIDADESSALDRLRTLIVDAGSGGSPLQLAALAMYQPLGALPQAPALADRSWPPPLRAVIAQQIAEPAQECALRAGIPRLTAIGDGVTAAVRQQYEENPYPRWVRVAPAPRAVDIAEHLRRQFPAAAFRPVSAADRLDILVAGCGTGRHAIELVQAYRGAHVLAVDLSLASLAYGKHRVPPHLAGAIEFAQADILGIGAIGRTFDVINAGGVLHHMDDPFAGWRELIKLLRPDGVMQVGLYSELARADVVAARALIAARGYQPTADGIRACRQELLATPMRELLLKFSDYFTISGCRDLLFHVHERRMTIPQIKAFLAASGLKFIGFEFNPPEAHAYYRDVFAGNGWSLSDLDRWHAFETAQPRTFAGMYQLWVQRNATSA